MGLSIVIPAYNEQAMITKVVKDIQSATKSLKPEIIVVNDGSTDNTRATAEKIKGIKLINHPYNKGYGASLKTGIRNSIEDYVLIIDADGQHQASDILRFYKLRKKYDMIIGARKNITSKLRSIPKVMLGLFANYLAGRRLHDLNSGFRLMNKEMALEYLKLLPNKFSFTTTITLLAVDGGFSIQYIPIIVNHRKTGRSTMHPINDTLNILLLIIRSTMLINPLKVFIPASFVLLIVGLLWVIYGLEIYASFPRSATTIFIASMFTFFFGLIADQISQMRRSQ